MKEGKLKILFHYSRLNIGGAERSITKLANILVENNWDVTLVLDVGDGKYENKLDEKIKVVHFFPKPWKMNIVSQKTMFRKFTFLALYSLPVLFYTILTFIRKNSFRFKKYDAAIISLQGLNPTFVSKYVNAKRKYLYLRSDLSKVKKKQIAKSIIKFNNSLDGYLCVSNTVLESLDSINPKFKEKAHVLYNIVNVEEIKSWKKPVIAVCKSGGRSGQVTQFLSNHGIDVINGGPWQNVDQYL